MKFCVISSGIGELSTDLKNEIEKREHEFFFLSYNDVNFGIKNNKFNVFDGTQNDLLGYDVYIFRAFMKNLDNIRLFTAMLKGKGKTIIDECLVDDYFSSKLYEGYKLTNAGLPYVNSFLFSNKNGASEYVGEFPVIVKSVKGARGEGIFLVKNRTDFERLLEGEIENWNEYLVQEYLPIEYDIRVFVVGGKVLGAIKRSKAENDFRTNASVGGSAEKFDLTDEMKDIALRATKAMSYEVAGVDIIQIENEIYILEVNIAPQWKKFKEVIGVNPASEIIDYLIEKNGKNGK